MSLMTSTPHPSHPSSRRPTHHEVATFIESYLPPPLRPRDVNFVYHTPWEYRQRPVSVQGNGFVSTTNDTAEAPLVPIPPPPPLPPPPNTTLTTHTTFAIVPNPGVYASLRSSPAFTSRPRTAPLAFIHRPWSLDRGALPRGTTVLASHTGFDERLTVGWNVGLAGRLGVVVGGSGEDRGVGEGDGKGDGKGCERVVGGGGKGSGIGAHGDVEAAAEAGVEVKAGAGTETKDHRQENCYCIQGYKGDPERRIGLVGGFGFGSHGAFLNEENEDADGGVKLDPEDASTNISSKTVTETRSAPAVKRVRLNHLLVRISEEFAGVGEVFDFSSQAETTSLPLLDQAQQDLGMEKVHVSTTMTTAVGNVVVTDAGTASVVAPLSTLHDITNITTTASNDQTTPLLPPSTFPTPPQAALSNPEHQTLPPPQPFKRQKKSKAKPKAPPPPPLPPSIALATAAQGSAFPDEIHVTAIAIMNAFHPEEIERAIAAASEGGWIDWKGVGVHSEPDGGSGRVATGEGRLDMQVKPDTTQPTTQLTASASPLHNSHQQTDIVQPRPTPSSTAAPFPPIMRNSHTGATLTPALSIPLPPAPSSDHILFLTGAPRAPGLQHIKQYYADRATVVCVGHAACEEWGVRYLAAECARRWPSCGVRVVFEEEGESGKDGAV